MKKIVFLLIILLFLLTINPTFVGAVTFLQNPVTINNYPFDGFHTHEQVNEKIDLYAAAYPQIAKKYFIGTSHQGKQIYALKISDNVSEKEAEIRLALLGNQHAREFMGTEASIYFIHYLLTNYNSNQEVKNLVDQSEIFIIPTNNPDGRTVVEKGHKGETGGTLHWKKNGRDLDGDGILELYSCIEANCETDGVNLEYNYDFFWETSNKPKNLTPIYSSYRGPSALSEPETQGTKSFIDSNPPDYFINMHSWGGDIMVPYSYSQQPTPEHDLFIPITTNIANILNKTADVEYYFPILTGGYTTQLGGTIDDYLYYTYNTMAISYELNQWGEQNSGPADYSMQMLEPTVKAAKDTFVYLISDDPANRFKPIPVSADYDGDGKIDKGTYHKGEWIIEKPNGGTTTTYFGGPVYTPVPGDYDGDGKTDLATYNETNYNYYIQFSSGQEPTWLANHSRRNTDTGIVTYYLGWEGTTPIVGDFDGDSKTDLALYKPDWSGTNPNYDWHIVYSTGGEEPFDWGATGYEPIVGDYDGDGKDDLAIYETATGLYSIRFSTGTEPTWLKNLNQTAATNGTYASRRDTLSGFPRYYLGWEGTTPVTGDFDGDGYTDLATYKTNWYGSPNYYDWVIVYSSGTPEAFIDLGSNGDFPIPGNYGGDLADDLATYNPTSNTWQLNYSQQITPQEPDPPQTNPICSMYQDRYDLTQWTNSINQWRIGQHSILEIIRRATIWRYCN
jgi:hypothetical protein